VAFRQVCCFCSCCYVPRTTFSYRHILMKAALSLNVFWQRTSKPLLHINLSSFMFKTLWTVLCICLA